MAPLAAVLVGPAATAATATAAAVPATAGIVGAGGAVTVGGLATTAGIGLGVAGTLQAGRASAAQVGAQTQAQVVQARSLQNIASFNALVMRREAEAIKQRALFEQKRQAERGARVKSALVARIAAAGGLGSPVAADLAAEQAAELELENLLVGFEGEILAGRAETQAELDRLQARIFGRRAEEVGRVGRITARNLRTASFLGAGKTLLTGFGSAFA